VVLEPEVKAARAFPEPLVVVDPVDPHRNVASAVSLDQLATFVQASKDYLRSPSLAFFFPPAPRSPQRAQILKRLRARGTQVLAIALSVPKLSEDVLFPQARKARATIVDFLERHGFRIVASRAHLEEGEVLLLFELEVSELPKARQHWGPPPWLKNAEDFLDKWGGSAEVLAGPYIQEGRLVFDVVRKHTSAADLLRAEIPRLSLGKNLDEAARKGLHVLEGAQAAEGHAKALAEFIDRGFPWRRAS
jgi:tRNA nucleotidyltransferase (CCA-adding enzyme)